MTTHLTARQKRTLAEAAGHVYGNTPGRFRPWDVWPVLASRPTLKRLTLESLVAEAEQAVFAAVGLWADPGAGTVEPLPRTRYPRCPDCGEPQGIDFVRDRGVERPVFACRPCAAAEVAASVG